MIQAVMDWAGTYDYQFTIRGRHYGKIRRRGVVLAENCGQIRLIDFDFREKERFTYEYHWGSPWADTYMWRCDIRMERGLRCREKDPKNPECIAGVGVSPPEDCEGPKAFTEFRDLFSPDYFAHRLEEMKADGDVKRYEEELRDLEPWRRTHFDRRAVNQKLKQMMDNPAVDRGEEKRQ